MIRVNCPNQLLLRLIEEYVVRNREDHGFKCRIRKPGRMAWGADRSPELMIHGYRLFRGMFGL